MSTTLTPYAAAKLTNAVLKDAGLPNIPPQMMYNYTTARLNKGKAPLIKCDAAGGIMFADLEAWLTKYMEKKGVKVEPTTPKVPAGLEEWSL